MNESLATLLQLAERQRDAARAALMQAEGQSNRALAQLEQLRAYQADYETRAPGGGGRAAPIELLRCHQGFMGRLEQALQQQQQAVAQAETALRAQHERWQEAELKLASVKKLLERQQQQAQQVQARRDQRHSDESALQRHRRTSGFGSLH